MTTSELPTFSHRASPSLVSLFTCVIRSMRPNFLILTGAILLLLMAYVHYRFPYWSGPLFFLVSVAAFGAHISVNMLNEFEDFNSGLDFQTEKTPFSGGSGALLTTPSVAGWVANIGYFFLGMVFSLGLFFVYLRGADLLPMGVIGLGLIYFYTRYLLRLPWVALVASGVGFGPLMFYGGFYVMTGTHDWGAFVLSLIPFFMVNNLLLLNQVPDRHPDRAVGRFNIIHKYGLLFALWIYRVQWASAFALLILLVNFDVLPIECLWALSVIILSAPVLFQVKYLPTRTQEALRILPLNVLITLLMPTAIALGLFFS